MHNAYYVHVHGKGKLGKFHVMGVWSMAFLLGQHVELHVHMKKPNIR